MPCQSVYLQVHIAYLLAATELAYCLPSRARSRTENMDRQLHDLQGQEEALQTRNQALERRIINVSP